MAPSGRGDDLDLAARFGLRSAAVRDPAAWQLVRTKGRMELHPPGGDLPLALDLGQGTLARRLRGARRDEPLPRACGLHRRTDAPTVLDATAGLCRDAMVLAHLGCQVVALERVPALAFLAHDAIAGSWLAANLRVVATDALAWLAAAPAALDVVCLDPMFEAPGKAQVKKDMQVCRQLAGPTDDPAELFAAARRHARERVVVKRAVDAPPLHPDVSFAITGERVRFDVYLAAAR